ncbi:MAG TPA: hypothetical protein V6D08_20135 [Candidatus Obscuribacterales bacterium]
MLSSWQAWFKREGMRRRLATLGIALSRLASQHEAVKSSSSKSVAVRMAQAEGDYWRAIDALAAVDLKNVLQRWQHRSADRARNRLDALVRNYRAAVEALDNGDRQEAQRLVEAALHDLAQVRESIFKPDGTLTFSMC